MATPAPKIQRLRFTPRKDGSVRTSIGMEMHITDEIIDFVAERLGCSRAEAAEKLVREAASALGGWLSSQRLIAKDGMLSTHPYDQVDEELEGDSAIPAFRAKSGEPADLDRHILLSLAPRS